MDAKYTKLFEAKFRKGPKQSCWLWQASVRGQGGYGQCTFSKEKQGGAHIFSYLLYVGPIPEGTYVCHTCHTPRCVNPNHLYAGTPQSNVDDMYAAGREADTTLTRHLGEDNGRSKLSEEQVREVRKLASSTTQVKLGKRFGVSGVLIGKIINNKIWVHVK